MIINVSGTGAKMKYTCNVLLDMMGRVLFLFLFPAALLLTLLLSISFLLFWFPIGIQPGFIIPSCTTIYPRPCNQLLSPALPKAKRQCQRITTLQTWDALTLSRKSVLGPQGPRSARQHSNSNSQTQTSQTKQDLRNSPEEPSLEEPSTCGSLIPFPGHRLRECHTISHLEKRLSWPWLQVNKSPHCQATKRSK